MLAFEKRRISTTSGGEGGGGGIKRLTGVFLWILQKFQEHFLKEYLWATVPVPSLQKNLKK